MACKLYGAFVNRLSVRTPKNRRMAFTGSAIAASTMTIGVASYAATEAAQSSPSSPSSPSLPLSLPLRLPLGSLSTSPSVPYTLLAGPGQEAMAARLTDLYPSHFVYFPTRWGRFSDNTDNIKVGGFAEGDADRAKGAAPPSNASNAIAGRNVVFLASFHSNDVALSQFHVMCMLGESFPNSINFVLPFFPTGTMERVTEEGVCATANTTAKIFSNLPSGAQRNRLMVYDLHTLQNRFYFAGNTLATLHTAFPLILQQIKKIQSENPGAEVAVAFPDAGAEKRFGPYFSEAYPNMATIVCGKKRDRNDPDKRTVKILDGDANGKVVIIVDDLVQTGGTLAGCAKILKNQGAHTVTAFCTHAVFPRDSWKRFTKGGDLALFDKFYVTNSNPTVTDKLPAHDCFEVLDIAPIIAEDLFKLHIHPRD